MLQTSENSSTGLLLVGKMLFSIAATCRACDIYVLDVKFCFGYTHVSSDGVGLVFERGW